MACVCCGDPCPSGGACCIGGQCVEGLKESECVALGGTFQGCCKSCQPVLNANGTVTYPCGDTSTPTCCEVFRDRVSQLICTVAGAQNGPGNPPFENPELNCECLNGTYIYDLLDPMPTAGLLPLCFGLRSGGFESDQISCPAPEFFGLPGEQARSEVQALAQCCSWQSNAIPGQLNMSIGGQGGGFGFWARHIWTQTSGIIAVAQLNSDWLAEDSVSCGKSCDDLIDELLAAFPLTTSLNTTGSARQGDRCDFLGTIAVNATLTVEFA